MSRRQRKSRTTTPILYNCLSLLFKGRLQEIVRRLQPDVLILTETRVKKPANAPYGKETDAGRGSNKAAGVSIANGGELHGQRGEARGAGEC